MNKPQQPDFNSIWWESAKLARTAQVDYGRWIVNTLWLMHSGAIAGLLTKWDGHSPVPYPTAITFFVAGIVLAFLTASFAWLNFTVSEAWFKSWTYAGDKWSFKPVDKHSRWLKWTTFTCVVAVGCSIACLIGGAVCILCG
jgi:hypothetical protein